MIAISLMIEGQNGLNWPRWKRLVAEAEQLGFAGLFRSDHFTNGQGPLLDSLESIVSLTYLADHTQRIHFGPLVAPVSFRDPTILARQASALDDLSGGRMILGVGAGWQEREHRMFGHDLGDIPTRMARLEEGLEALTRLLRSDEPVTYHGRFFQLEDALILPRPERAGGPPILIGGTGEKRTLPLVARYADIWNALMVSPDEFRTLSGKLDELLQAEGRPPSAVRRTLMTNLTFAPDRETLARRLHLTDASGSSLDDAVASIHATRKNIVGTPEMVREQIAAYAASGVEEIMMQWLDLDDIEGLRAFAQTTLPSL
ncbi:MAG TPA: TIGR03560 family F420-dependent LLM class oxidoreductase [Ktedonobacterales bacterium]|nr:TIGR03560 family F420-dependent LLM class oxidoreductase [Ktedonobacterales bacterium]